jgi:hypothetical protein
VSIMEAGISQSEHTQRTRQTFVDLVSCPLHSLSQNSHKLRERETVFPLLNGAKEYAAIAFRKLPYFLILYVLTP